jgi:hypothetical protein
MAKLPQRSTLFQDLEIQAELKVELLARQHEVSATKILLRVLLTMVGREMLAKSDLGVLESCSLIYV